MSACDYLLAIVLLSTPPDAGLCRSLAPIAEAVRPAITNIAVALELLDRRKVDSLWAETDGPGNELRVLQGRFTTLRSAPPLSECARFPSRQTTSEFIAANRAYRSSLEARLIVDRIHARDLRAAIAETDRLHEVWRLLADAQYEGYFVSARRDALLRIREVIGLDPFCRAQMPPHLPVWRFPLWR